MTTNEKEREATEGARGFVEVLNGAIRENPVSAGLVGLGIMWMFFGNAKGVSLAYGLRHATGQVTDAVRSAADGVGAAAAGMASSAGEAVQHSSEAVVSGAEKVADAMISVEQKVARAATDFGRDMGQSLQNNVNLTMDRQPLLLGLIGVGVGAGVASMFSSTSVEQELVGEAASKVKDKFQDIAGLAGQRAEKVFDDVKREANVQGLTRESASDGLKSVMEKVIATASVAKESILTSTP